MATEIVPTNLADVDRVAPVVPAVRAALVVPEDPVELAVRVALVVRADPVVPAVLVVQEDPAVLVALVVQEDPAVLVALEHVQVEAELEHAQAAVEQERDQVEPEPEHAQAVAELERVRAGGAPERGPVAVPLRTKSVIAVHHRGLPLLLAAVVDLVAAAQTMREPAATEAVIAWEAADIVAVAAAGAVTEPAVVVEVAVAEVTVAEDAAEAEDADDKGRVNDEETNENKNKYYDFAENFSGRFCGPYFLFVNDRSARCAIGQNRCACDIAASPKTIRHAETGSRRPYSGSSEFRCRRRKGDSGAGRRGSNCFRGSRSR
jgi:hypothetical protein